jgi:hypothetical protein
MARSGQIRTKIDELRKKIAGKGPSLDPARRRGLHKRLKRLQRARRVALAREGQGAAKPKAAEGPAAAPPPTAG